MRLTCPNCNAQYEVDEKVIPKGGRDVQCSACGHTWYQYPMDVALQMRAAELDDDDEDFDEDEPAPQRAPDPGGARPAERPGGRIDKTVLDVLREEAEREMTERRKAQSGIETQGDLGLTRPTRSKAAPSRVYGEDDPPPPPPAADAVPEPTADEAGEPARRRKVLPDIEELSSTLEPGSERRDDDDDDGADAEEQRGFRRGLSLVMLVALALIVLYLVAPILGNAVPALAGPLGLYVTFVDGLRVTVAGTLRGLLGG
ncbi:MAG: zinc-ribbon domain-containing protein [Rhodobacteraceae bacterium]|nr:zinc-ribbon domain-containing protein [Paracoccaceae bacterium]